MKKLTCFIIGFLLVAVVVLSVAVGYLFTEENGELSVGPIPSPATSSAQTEPSEVLENEGSNKFEDSSIVPKDEITGLRCSVELGALDVIEGEDFDVSALDIGDYTVQIENGTYIVNGSAVHDNHIIVTIPKDFQFQEVELLVTGGTLTAEGVDTQNLHVNCNKGAIEYSGSVDAGAEIQQLHGKTVINIDGKQTDYNYSLDIDLGHIGIDDQQYAGTHQHQDIDNQAEKSISACCTMGSVSILFSEPN